MQWRFAGLHLDKEWAVGGGVEQRKEEQTTTNRTKGWSKGNVFLKSRIRHDQLFVTSATVSLRRLVHERILKRTVSSYEKNE
jgi:hypothetical protein